MKTMIGRCWIACLLFTTPLMAEVAVYEFAPNDDGAVTPITIVRSIIDDVDPYVWDGVALPTPGLHVLNSSGAATGDGPPSILHVVGDGPIVVWSRGGDIVLSRFDSGGWTPESTIVDDAAIALDPALVRDAAGDYHVVYAQSDAIWLRSSSDLLQWSSAERLSPLGLAASAPTATLHDGQLRVGYELHISGLGVAPKQVEVASLDPVTGWQREIVSTTWELDATRPTLRSAAGKLWVEWREGLFDVIWSRRESNGEWSAPALEASTSLEEREFHAPGRIRRDASLP